MAQRPRAEGFEELPNVVLEENGEDTMSQRKQLMNKLLDL
jgi:hypothetical protein